jgi:hypothetical protein
MLFKTFNLRYRLLAPFRKLHRADDKAMDDCHLIHLPAAGHGGTASTATVCRQQQLGSWETTHLPQVHKNSKKCSDFLLLLA